MTDNSGTIASDVTGIQFTFTNPDTSNGNAVTEVSRNGSSGGTLIQEFQVFGTASPLPEPSTLALFGLAGAGMLILVMRRRPAR